MTPVWTVEHENEKLKVKVLRMSTTESNENLGYLSLDFKHRCWDTGSHYLGVPTRTAAMWNAHVGSYEGSGWKKRLEEDAKTYLHNLMKE